MLVLTAGQCEDDGLADPTAVIELQDMQMGFRLPLPKWMTQIIVNIRPVLEPLQKQLQQLRQSRN